MLSSNRLTQSGFVVTHGRVLEVECSRDGIWLETDDPPILWIKPKILKAFDMKQVVQMTGRSLEVRG